MMKPIRFIVSLLALTAAFNVFAVDFETNTPAAKALRQSLRDRFHDLRPYLDSGAVGLTSDGMLAVRDASSVPLAQRQAVNAMVASQNNDRNALYAEIANANGHPEWQAEIRNTFAQRWIQRAKPGWWVQDSGGWKQK
jgi:hypothetical protein